MPMLELPDLPYQIVGSRLGLGLGGKLGVQPGAGKSRYVKLAPPDSGAAEQLLVVAVM